MQSGETSSRSCVFWIVIQEINLEPALYNDTMSIPSPQFSTKTSFSTYFEIFKATYNYVILHHLRFLGGAVPPIASSFPSPCSAMERSRSRATAPAALPRPEAEEESEEDVTGLVQRETQDGNIYIYIYLFIFFEKKHYIYIYMYIHGPPPGTHLLSRSIGIYSVLQPFWDL